MVYSVCRIVYTVCRQVYSVCKWVYSVFVDGCTLSVDWVKSCYKFALLVLNAFVDLL